MRCIDEVTEAILRNLALLAWRARENAVVVGKTKVGCAIRTRSGQVFAGCNVEHRFRCHDVHAEINAITTMVASGERDPLVFVIAAERDRFTPCGGCMDWIMQFGGPSAVVAFQSAPGSPFTIHTAKELMPYYPE
jgi:cytidine deaminase